MRRVFVGLVCLGLSCGCGRKGPPPAHGSSSTESTAKAPDLSTPEAVLTQAHRALLAGDLPTLRAYMTARGYVRVCSDLEAWRSYLADPVTGPRIASRIALPDDPAEREAARAAIASGDPAAVLALYVRADPRAPLAPLAPAVRGADVERVELTYPARDGALRRVLLQREGDAWRIDRLQL